MAIKTEIQMLYDEIPSFKCKEGCCDCCDNYIQYAQEEADRAGGFEYTERMCPHIKNGRCSVYPNRAFICRIYGASEIMPCPHGFKPENPLSQEKTMELLKKYLKLRKEQEIKNNI
ncbi:MAG: hypothetical protein K0S55_2148 [Clostridia bacterium]|nr:hypothetical protein [Clostridia bacterium]